VVGVRGGVSGSSLGGVHTAHALPHGRHCITNPHPFSIQCEHACRQLYVQHRDTADADLSSLASGRCSLVFVFILPAPTSHHTAHSVLTRGAWCEQVSKAAMAATAKVDTMHAEWQTVDARFKSMAHMTEVVRAAAVEAARTEAIALVEATAQVAWLCFPQAPCDAMWCQLPLERRLPLGHI
jgi:hypothetical protein